MSPQSATTGSLLHAFRPRADVHCRRRRPKSPRGQLRQRAVAYVTVSHTGGAVRKQQRGGPLPTPVCCAFEHATESWGLCRWGSPGRQADVATLPGTSQRRCRVALSSHRLGSPNCTPETRVWRLWYVCRCERWARDHCSGPGAAMPSGRAGHALHRGLSRYHSPVVHAHAFAMHSPCIRHAFASSDIYRPTPLRSSLLAPRNT